MPPNPNVARTHRLILRRLNPNDSDALRDVLCDPEVMRYSMGVLRRDDVPAWIDERVAEYARWGFGLWGVELLVSGRLIGYCGLTVIEIDGQPEIEIGYRLARAHWGRGLANEVASAVRDWFVRERRVSLLVALIEPDNHASIRVARKLGMHLELPVMLPGYDHPDHLYVLTADQDDLL